MYRIFILVLLSVFLNAETNDRSYNYDSDRTMIKTYLKAINKLRSQPRKCGDHGFFKSAVPLKWSDKLYRASREHAHDMATHNLIYHDGSGKNTDITGNHKGSKSKTTERALFHGYTYKKAFALAENVGAGLHDVDQIVNAWIQSPGHCANIMNPTYREMALAKSSNPKSYYRTFWTLKLGFRL